MYVYVCVCACVYIYMCVDKYFLRGLFSSLCFSYSCLPNVFLEVDV